MEHFEWQNILWEPLYNKKKSPLGNNEQQVRVAAYCRVSVKKEDGYKSLENQVSYYTQLIRSQKNYKMVGVYFDYGISAASTTNRNGFRRLIRHCEEERIDLILTKSISRFSRNSKELIETVKHLHELGTTIYFERENLDTSRDYNSFVLSVQAAIAQDEIEANSQLCKFGYERRLMEGKPYFKNAYGYDVEFKDGEALVTINEAEAKVVRWIYQEFINGKTYNQINRELIERGIKTKKGNFSWSNTMVRKILSNVIYKGDKLARAQTKDLLTGKIKKTTDREQYLINNTHPAIISDEVFKLVQERVAEVSYKNRPKYKERKQRPFSKRITCGRCKKRFRAQYSKQWHCGNALSSVNLCRAKRLNDKILKEMCIKAFAERFNSVKDLLKILQTINRNDHFEFHRLKLLAEIEILKSTVEVQKKREQYTQFEERVSKIEDDRNYRELALDWLSGIKSIEEFESTITIELIRAWVMEIEVYSKDAFIVKWIDELETVIGEAEIEEIKEEQKLISTLTENIKQPSMEIDTTISENKGVKKMIDVNTRSPDRIKMPDVPQSNPDIIKLEPGMGIEAVKDIKKSLGKTKALNILSKNSQKLKVASYCRVSTHEGQQFISLKTQIAYYTYLILKNPKWDFSGIYADRGLSGTSTNSRIEFNRMIEAAKAGKIDLIITKSISRFSRNVVDVLEVIKTLRELPKPVHCYFEKENIHTADKEASLLITVMGAIAENEVSNLSKNIRWGITKLAQRGIIHKTTDIYGYTIDKDRNWEIVPDQAEAINFIAKEFIAGRSYTEIIQKLHTKGIKSPNGKEYWNDHQIGEMLKNEKYKGDYLYQKTFTPEVIGSKARYNRGDMPQYYIEDHHPAIIESKEWDLIQEELKRRSRIHPKDTKPLRTAGRESFYRKFSCSECGGVITRFRCESRIGKKGSIWRCYNSYGTFNVDCSNGLGLREKYLEFHFMSTLKETEKLKELAQQEIEKLKLTQEELTHQEEIQRDMETLYQELYDAVGGEIAKDGRDTKRIDFLTEEIIKLQNQLKEYTERVELREHYQQELNNLLKLCAQMEPLSFREYHQMDMRIAPGESLYNTTKTAKDETYIKESGSDKFREDLFNRYVLKGEIDDEGRISYSFIFGFSYGCDMVYEDYLEAFEQTKVDINLEELLNSKEVKKIKKICKVAKAPKEIRGHLGIESRVSFDKRILKPLVQAGMLKLIRGARANDWRYYWDEG